MPNSLTYEIITIDGKEYRRPIQSPKIIERLTQDQIVKKILEVSSIMILNRSDMTTNQLFNEIEKKDLVDYLVYTFPLLPRGDVLAFEAIMSKEVIKQAQLNRPEMLDADILQEMRPTRF